MTSFLPSSAAMAFSKEPTTGEAISLERPRVITLCGSTRFMNEFEKANTRLTLQGNVVFSVATTAYEGSQNVSDEQKKLLDKVHFEKIRLSDEIFVINVGGYVGPSTKREIELAKRTGKKIRFLESSTAVD